MTESISRPIPIVVSKLQLDAYPEGGDLVEGLPARVYFAAKTPLGKPADVAGRIVDDRGTEVATFRSHEQGMGRFVFTPEKGRRYHAEITSPTGITDPFELPEAKADGCVLRHFDDIEGQLAAIRVGVRCTDAQQVNVQAVLRGTVIDGATVEVPADAPAFVHLQNGDERIDGAQGVARITVFDGKQRPLAERLVYRNRQNVLNVEITPDKSRYTPRDPVALALKATDGQGRPVEADLAVAVVDDTVLSYADDKQGHMLAQVFLESELHEKVEEPNTYFDLDDPGSALALDHLLGTRGWRTFDWAPVLNPTPVVAWAPDFGEAELLRVMDAEVAVRQPRRRPRRPMARPAPPMDPAPPPVAVPVPQEQKVLEEPVALDGLAGLGYLVGGDMDAGAVAGKKAKEWANFGDEMDKNVGGRWWAPVRVFPTPTYERGLRGPPRRLPGHDLLERAGPDRRQGRGPPSSSPSTTP